MKQKLIFWVEEYLFFPNFFQKLLSLCLLPLTLIYTLIVIIKRTAAKPIYFGVPIISIGNLVVGGSGKTPMTIFLAKDKKNACVILRGYGRASKGLFVVSLKGKILETIENSGDEAMLIAQKLPTATVIVSEDRAKAIIKAKELGCEIIFLDDGFSKYNIAKFDILLRPKIEPTNLFCLPSGGYREPKMMYATANLVMQEGIDFKRLVTYKYKGDSVSVLPDKLILLTAISKPQRLLEFLPHNVKLIAFEDHHTFTQEEITSILKEHKEYAIITTPKDRVKLEQFNLEELYVMDLELSLSENVDLSLLNNYLALSSKH
ncbi:MAG: tetraacyldisaccharide 4'-kinase [Arcobacteraceae bacterium]